MRDIKSPSASQAGELAPRPALEVEWRSSAEPVAYAEAVATMEQRAAAIRAGRSGELVWLLEHPALYTAGTSARPDELLDAVRLPVYPSGRGGRYTYHGPGQRVAYVLLDLDARGRDVRAYVGRLEAWLIAALAELGVRGERRAGRVGIWVVRGDGANQFWEYVLEHHGAEIFRDACLPEATFVKRQQVKRSLSLLDGQEGVSPE